MEPVKIAQNIQELPVIEKDVNLKFVQQDKFSRLTDVVLNAIHTHEHLLMEKFVCHTTAVTDINLALTAHVLNVQISRDLKELVLLVELINVISGRKYFKMVPVSTAHCSKQ